MMHRSLCLRVGLVGETLCGVTKSSLINRVALVTPLLYRVTRYKAVLSFIQPFSKRATTSYTFPF